MWLKTPKSPYKILIGIMCAAVVAGAVTIVVLLSKEINNSPKVVAASHTQNIKPVSSVSSAAVSSSTPVPAAASSVSSATASVAPSTPAHQYTANELLGMTRSDVISKVFQNQYQTRPLDIGQDTDPDGICNPQLYPYFTVGFTDDGANPDNTVREIEVASGGKISDNITVGMHYNSFLDTADSIEGPSNSESRYYWESAVMVKGNQWGVSFQISDATAKQKGDGIEQELFGAVPSGGLPDDVPFDVSDINPVSTRALLMASWANPLASSTSVTTGTIHANGGANLRTCPSQSSTKLISIANGSQVNILDSKDYGSWDEVYWNGKEGFVSNQYIN